MQVIQWVNEYVVWGTPMLILFMGTGLLFSGRLRFFQLNLPRILKETLFRKRNTEKADTGNLSPLQTLTSTLAVTLGTGNIVAIGTAIQLGGAGAVFWMWVSALVGMALTYAENYLGMRYRKQRADGTYIGGAFYYIEKAIGKPWGAFYAVCCVLACIGMGNMTQMNALSSSLNRTFETPLWLSGLMATALIGFMVFGGAKFFGEISEKVIPIISLIYIAGCTLVIILYKDNLGQMLGRIFSEAFNFRAAGGGILGSVMIKGMNWGLRRGVFSNEAGLGTTAILNTMTEEKSAQRQSLWATLCVFFDTVVMCSLTAFAILLTGADLSGIDGTLYASEAFGSAFGMYADGFVSICIVFFALATTSGWSVFGAVSIEYLFGRKPLKVYMVLFVICCYVGCVTSLEFIWGFADLMNGLMAMPNLIAMLALRKEVLFLPHAHTKCTR